MSGLSREGRRLLNNTSNQEAARAFLAQATPEDLVRLLAEHSHDRDQLIHQMHHWRDQLYRDLERILGPG